MLCLEARQNGKRKVEAKKERVSQEKIVQCKGTAYRSLQKEKAGLVDEEMEERGKRKRRDREGVGGGGGGR